MELKLGSVMLLLSCSLQQSLWGILASVPQTTANKCKNKISSEGAPTQRVQMIRRIPARCSGWDEAWSWISNKDCRTKYILDYVELPSAVQKVDQKDCEEEVAAKTENGHFNLADERYLAIAFGSATVALLILIVIIVISVVRRGNGCRMCSSRPRYTFANASEREHLDASNTARNDYVDDELKHIEPVYEEIHDRTNAKKKLDLNEDVKPPSYQNLYGEDCSDMNGGKTFPSDGVHRRPVTPSAPYEEELQKTACKSVPNEYSLFGDSTQQCLQQKSGNSDNIEKNSNNSITSEHANIEESDKDLKKDEDLKPKIEEKNESTKDNKVINDTKLPSNSSKSLDNSLENVQAEVDDKVSNKSVHSYENLNKTGESSVEDYEPLTNDDREVCFNTSTHVSDNRKASVKSLHEENA